MAETMNDRVDADLLRMIDRVQSLLRSEGRRAPLPEGVYLPLFLVHSKRRVYRFFGYDEHGGLEASKLDPAEPGLARIIAWLKEKPGYNSYRVFTEVRKGPCFIACTQRQPADTELSWETEDEAKGPKTDPEPPTEPASEAASEAPAGDLPEGAQEPGPDPSPPGSNPGPSSGPPKGPPKPAAPPDAKQAAFPFD